MDHELFRRDLERVPESLSAVADAIGDGRQQWLTGGAPRRVLLTGMGSSYFAAHTAALRLRAAGLDAVAELASVERTWPSSPDLLVVAISASGESHETQLAVEPHLGRSQVVALTNAPDSTLTTRADRVVEMHAGQELGGVACRSFRNTIAALLGLAHELGASPNPVAALRSAARASSDLLDRVDRWLPPVVDALASPDGTWFLAPAERLSTALQSALMVREGPRRRADGCETGDWSHVDVYLTKTLDYRAVVFAGSRFDEAAARWMTERGSKSVTVGGAFPGSVCEVRYPNDGDPDVAVLTEVLVAELLAATWWSERGEPHGPGT